MKQILLGLLLAAPLSAAAQALTPDVMQRITTANALTRQDVALRNALAANGIDAIAKHGVKSVIQPGGSVSDAEIIDAANHHGMAMVFTGQRAFKH